MSKIKEIKSNGDVDWHGDQHQHHQYYITGGRSCQDHCNHHHHLYDHDDHPLPNHHNHYPHHDHYDEHHHLFTCWVSQGEENAFSPT